MGNNCECCNDEKLAKLQAIIAENKGKQGALIQVLHEAQLIYGYLPIEVQKVIAEGMNIPLAEVYGVVTFYAQFSLKPKGEYKISICLGTACYVKGADLVLDKFKEQLNIEVGDCTADGKFSLDACRCIGACGLAPVLTINSDVYGRLVPEDVPGILAKY
ncbi:MAG: NAD(P)H-dependent oxidoreductase subunit E [Clostridia bacterium]|nr:NAD(P)H-dependent oxidoreductase subunit E [Clostridia bacterium]